MSTVLPSRVLKLMRPADRAKLGKAGQTAEEAEAAFVTRTEAQLQSLIQTMLQRNGIYVVHNRMDKRPTVAVGCPDLLFAVNGRPVAWEVKLPGKKPTKEQVEAMLEMDRNGWQTAIVQSYAEALGLFNRLLLEEHKPTTPHA